MTYQIPAIRRPDLDSNGCEAWQAPKESDGTEIARFIGRLCSGDMVFTLRDGNPPMLTCELSIPSIGKPYLICTRF